MTIFVDASVIVAILAGEDDREPLTETILNEDVPLWSAISRWEAVAGLRHGHGISLDEARERVDTFAKENDFVMVVIGKDEAEAALKAYQLYGKGRHPAALNMGDCFAYACAKANDARLFYKGDDFARTDLA